jgi:protein-L-isoaspartate(D-aspartate) O-methyltransferase
LSTDSDKTRRLRRDMVEKQLRRRGVADEKVLEAMDAVPRHSFMPGYSAEAAYGDHAMPIGHGQTISQPYMVAVMTQELVKNAASHGRVLEIGTGSGYQAAILARIFDEVISIERVEPLVEPARRNLDELGFSNITVVAGDGTLGYPPTSPYDGIIVTAGAPHVPAALKRQLADGGALVIPVGSRYLQQLEIITRKGERYRTGTADGCVFVPLIGEDGWDG